MALTDVFHKTPKGAAELAARSVKLAPMTRMALVIIDGIKPVAELAGKLGGEAAAQTALTELLGHGLIALAAAEPLSGAGNVVANVVANAVANAAGTGATAAVAVAAKPAMSFEDLCKWATRHVSGAMGPMGDDYCLPIERAKTQPDLDAAATRAKNAIDSFTTRSKADAFWKEYEEHRGA